MRIQYPEQLNMDFDNPVGQSSPQKVLHGRQYNPPWDDRELHASIVSSLTELSHPSHSFLLDFEMDSINQLDSQLEPIVENTNIDEPETFDPADDGLSEEETDPEETTIIADDDLSEDGTEHDGSTEKTATRRKKITIKWGVGQSLSLARFALNRNLRQIPRDKEILFKSKEIALLRVMLTPTDPPLYQSLSDKELGKSCASRLQSLRKMARSLQLLTSKTKSGGPGMNSKFAYPSLIGNKMEINNMANKYMKTKTDIRHCKQLLSRSDNRDVHLIYKTLLSPSAPKGTGKCRHPTAPKDTNSSQQQSQNDQNSQTILDKTIPDTSSPTSSSSSSSSSFFSSATSSSSSKRHKTVLEQVSGFRPPSAIERAHQHHQAQKATKKVIIDKLGTIYKNMASNGEPTSDKVALLLFIGKDASAKVVEALELVVDALLPEEFTQSVREQYVIYSSRSLPGRCSHEEDATTSWSDYLLSSNFRSDCEKYPELQNLKPNK